MNFGVVRGLIGWFYLDHKSVLNHDGKGEDGKGGNQGVGDAAVCSPCSAAVSARIDAWSTCSAFDGDGANSAYIASALSASCASSAAEAKKNQGEREMDGLHVGCGYFDGTGKKFLIFWHLMNVLSERVCTRGKKSSGYICA